MRNISDDVLTEIAIVTNSELEIRFAGDSHQAAAHNGSPLEGDLVGKHLLDHISDIPREEALTICKTILAGGRFAGGARCFRKELPGSSGQGRWVAILGPHTDGSGRVDGVVYARLRMDDGESMDRYAVAPDKLYEILVDSASELVFLLDPNGIITFINRRVAVISGFPPSQFVGRHFSEVIHHDDVEKCREAIGHVFRDGSPYTDLAFRAVTPDGTIYHLVANGSLVQTGDGPRVLGVCRNVTEAIALGEQLAARNTALSALNEIVVALTSSESVDISLNMALGKILAAVGLGMGGILLKGKDGLLSMRAGAGVDMDWYEARRDAITEIFNRYGDSITKPKCVKDIYSYSYRGENIKDLIPEGNVQGVVVVPLKCGNEMTAVLVLALPPPAELSMEQMEFVNLAAGILGPAVENAQLFEAGRVKSLQLEALAREARHRIKNNLQIVAGLLNMCDKESGEERRAVKRCLRQIGTISSVNDLLNPVQAREGVRLNECLVRIASSAIEGTGRSDDIELCIEGEDCELSADVATALGIIVNELMTNAIVHGFRGRGKGHINIRMLRDGDRNVVEVRDHGVGLPDGFIPPQDQDSTSGLGIVRSLATHGLGGTLEIAVAEDGGTCARISF